MNDVDLYGLIMITILIGGFLTFLGWVMKSQNAGDIINGFDPKKYSKEKVSQIVGGDMMYSGLLILLAGAIGAFLNTESYNYITFVQVWIAVIGIIKMMYDLEKRCRIDK